MKPCAAVIAVAASALSRVGEAQTDGSGEYSILTNEPSRAATFIQRVPSAGSYENLFEFGFQPIDSALEESGGFSAIDPQKLSIYGNSPYWTQWYFERFNITDTLFSGAAALRLPYRFLGSVGIRFNEDPSNVAPEGLVLGTGPLADRPEGPLAGYSLTLPQLGGIFPGGVGIVHAFSATHATERNPAPPSERPRFGQHQRFWVLDDEQTAAGRLRWAFDVDQGRRRFLSFAITDAAFQNTFEESFASASAALVFEPTDRSLRFYAAGEYRHRDHLFSELGYAPGETAIQNSAALFAGIATADFTLGLTVKAFSIEHRDLSFSRDVIDPDGEALEPFYPQGRYLTANATLRYEHGDGYYIDAANHVLSFSPSAGAWSNDLTYELAPYRTISFTSQDTLEAFGRNRAGFHGRLPLGPLVLSYDAFLEASYALNGAAVNSVFFLDPGLKAEIDAPLADGALSPFISVTRAPVPINGDLARIGDARYLTMVGREPLTVSPHLVQADIDTLALGFKSWLFSKWRFSLELLGRLYRGTYWIDRDPAGPGYVLTNYPGRLEQPFYAGVHAQLFRLEADRFLFDVSFSALTAIGYTAFGNGVTADDLGVLSYSTAAPNALVKGLAALDTDRAFITKGAFGFTPLEGLWIFAAVRHKDGAPFAFYDATLRDGSVDLTYHQNRGSPLSRSLIGARTDFRVDTDLRIQYAIAAGDLKLTASMTLTNAFDFGSELLERSNDIGKRTRAALELEIPRALVLGIEAAY